MRTIDGAMSDDIFTLECGHKRSKACPPLKTGRISFENFMKPVVKTTAKGGGKSLKPVEKQ